MTDDVGEFIEGFAVMLNQAGMQRMAARVFGALLAAQSEGLTAKQIGEVLGVSPAAVSGAVAYLSRTGLATRVRTPGGRVDHFVVDTTWGEAFAIETTRLHELAGWLTKGADSVPAGSPAHVRMSETRDFFEFIAAEMPKLIDRWHASQS